MFWRWLRVVPLAAAVVTGVALLLHPQTAWIFRTQIGQVLRPASNARFWAGKENNAATTRDIYLSYLQRIADSHPNDYQAQLAVVLEHYPPDMAERLFRLLSRFNDRVQLHAHILRYLTQRVSPNRPEADAMSMVVALSPSLTLGGAIPIGPIPSAGGAAFPTWYDRWLWLFAPALAPGFPFTLEGIPSLTSALPLDWYIHVAARGEQLDPQNAYFPAMRAVFHFIARQDKEGIDALLRASRKPRWDDYINDEPESRIHLYTLAFGRQPVHHRAEAYFGTMFPHVGDLRAAARTAAYLAYQLDIAGETKRATEIRLALVRLGRLMRTQGCHTITVLVGGVLGEIGCQTMPELHVVGFSMPDDYQVVEQRLPRMLNHLRQEGRIADIPWVERELRAVTATRKIIREGVKQDPVDIEKMILASASRWRLNLALLATALALLLLWMVFSLVARSPLQSKYATAVVLLSCLIFWGVWYYESEALYYGAECLKATFPTAVDLKGGFSQQSPASSPTFIARFLEWVRQQLGIYGTSETSLRELRIALLMEFESLLLLLIAAAAFGQLLRGTPGKNVVTEGLRRSGLSLASVLFLLYALSLLSTARVEKLGSERLTRMTCREVQYYAELLGTNLPE